MSDDLKTNEHSKPVLPVVGIWWWAMLVVAVLAVPSFGFMISLSVPSSGYGTLITFVLACWACTYIGMRLMQWGCKK